MAHTDDPIADRGAQLDAAYAVYSTGVDQVHAARRRAWLEADAAAAAAEAELFVAWQERVAEITGGPGPLAPPERPSTIGADQEAADIAESGE